MAHTINTTTWHVWRGGPPELAGQVNSTFSRAGTNGTGHQKLGYIGRPFQRQLVAYAASYAVAEANVRTVMALLDLDLVDIIYNGTHYRRTFQHRYKIVDVHIDAVDRLIIVGGIGSGVGGLTATLTFVPHPQI